MAVLIEAINVIVPCNVLEERFPGGIAEYEAQCPNSTYCSDGLLTRVGFMHPDDTKSFVDRLERSGLSLLGERGFEDVAIVDQQEGPTAPCKWLRFGEIPETGLIYAEFLSAPPSEGRLAVPVGWTPNRGIQRSDDVGDLERLAALDQITVFRDAATGRTFYTGRAATSGGEGPEPARE